MRMPIMLPGGYPTIREVADAMRMPVDNLKRIYNRMKEIVRQSREEQEFIDRCLKYLSARRLRRFDKLLSTPQGIRAIRRRIKFALGESLEEDDEES